MVGGEGIEPPMVQMCRIYTVHDSYESSSFNKTLLSLSRSTTRVTHGVNTNAFCYKGKK